MITINREYTITLLDSNVINYSISSNNNCIIINNTGNTINGTFNGTTKKIVVTYYVKDLDCFKDNLITVIVTNDKGCTNTFTDTLVNECNSLNVSLTQPNVNDLIFKATVTGGKQPYLFNWVYGSTNSFDSDEPESVDGYHSQDYVSLRWINTTIQEGTLKPQAIRVRVKDANGCIGEEVFYYIVSCRPVIASQTIAAKCFPLTTGDIRKFDLSLTNLGCGNLNNELLINYIGVTQTSKGNNTYEITVPEFSTTSIILPIKIRNDKNILSDTFNVTVIKSGDCKIKPDCAAGFTLDNYKNNIRLVEFDNEGAKIIDDILFSTQYIDYSTFTFIPGTGQTLANNILTITGKGTATFDAVNKQITFEKTIAVDEEIPIKWQIKNECGDLSEMFTLKINSVLSTAPSVTSLTKNVFVGDTSATTVTSNNGATIASLKILTPPTIGTLTVNRDTVNYIPINYSSTTQPVTLQPVNQYGKVGTEFTVTYTILSSGIARPFETCSAVTSYNLFDLLIPNGYTTGGTWTTTSGINIPQNNQVTISNAGLYNFIYTVTVGGITKTTTTSINYTNAIISSTEVTTQSASTRVIKITTSGFTTNQLSLITYVNVNVITATKQLSLSQSAVTRNNDILFTTIDITDTDGTILSDYTSIEVIIPQESSPCATNIIGTYVKPGVPLESSLTASVTVNNAELFSCDGDYTYTYDVPTKTYNGYKSIAAIAPVSPYGIEVGDSNVFGIYGTRIYPTGPNNTNGWDNNGDLKSGFTYQATMTTSYWQNTTPADFVKGPCNRYGIWADDGVSSTDLPFNKWIGFSKCITIAQSKIYYVGLFADNNFKLRLNGQTLLNTTLGGSLNGTQATFFYWHIYPIYIPAGNNTLELTGINGEQTGAFGCAIYDNTPAQLVAATSDADLNIIFNSRDVSITIIDIVESTLGVYENKGYTCPPGYTVYSPCGGNNCFQYIECTSEDNT
jgi:hypothetical protein